MKTYSKVKLDKLGIYYVNLQAKDNFEKVHGVFDHKI